MSEQKVDLRDESPLEIQAGIRLVTRPAYFDQDGFPVEWHEYILQVLAFVGPKLGYKWVDLKTVSQHMDGTDCLSPDDH